MAGPDAPARSGAAARAVRGYALAAHPEPALAVTAVTAALGVAAGAPRPALLAAAVLAGQLSVGWSNDWLDAGRDRAAGRRDKPAATGLVAPAALRTAALAAAAGAVVLSLLLGGAAGLLHLGAVAAAWGYNAGLKATPLSPLPYAVAFGALPSVVTLAAAGRPAPLWAGAAGLLLGLGAHLANVLPDLPADLATGVRGLPQRLGRARSVGLAVACLVGASAALALAPGAGPLRRLVVLPAAAGGAGVVLLGRRAGSRGPFRAVLLLALVDVALLVASGQELVH